MRNAFIIFAVVVVIATILAVFFRDAVLDRLYRTLDRLAFRQSGRGAQ